MLPSKRKFDHDIEVMRSVAKELIAQRRAQPRDDSEPDLLDRMLMGVDSVTGATLDDDNIVFQMITFLIAGHETTSGLLSFATYFLLRNPEVCAKARSLVDEVVGNGPLTVDQLPKLAYLEQILMETLRIWPTAPAFALSPREQTTLGGQYPVGPEDVILVLTPMLHRDPGVWGPDAEEFKPERFSPGGFDELPPNAWKPFGNGARACIGRAFAVQEAKLVLALMLQRFEFEFADDQYELKVKETLTLKPDGLSIKVKARNPGRTAAPRESSARDVADAAACDTRPSKSDASVPLLVLFGGNTGSAESLARRLAGEGHAMGFAAQVGPMDDYVGRLAEQSALVIVTASYEGRPPDNAAQLVEHINQLPNGCLSGVSYAVLGCGNRQWARTYQAVPSRVDEALARAGARRLLERGALDSGGDFFGEFERWREAFWPAAAHWFDLEATPPAQRSALDVKLLGDLRATDLKIPDLRDAMVIENRELVDMSADFARSKRHIELQLPAGMTYRAGDYLAVLPRNPQESVRRVLRHFGLVWESHLTLAAPSAAAMPIGRPIAAGELLSAYFELASPATRANVETLAEAARCPPEKDDLIRLAQERLEGDVLTVRLSVMDLLERFFSVQLPFAAYLAMLPTLRLRQYSISSSPLWNSRHVTLTVAVVDAPAVSGLGRHCGVASSHLAELLPGDRLSVAVRPSSARFHPPSDVRTPIVMICAGSGIAPFRGFIQQRAIQKRNGEPVGPAVLFFGMDDPNVDFLYEDELARWVGDGVVEVMGAYSAVPDGPASFVQDKVWVERERIVDLFDNGALFYVCGDGKAMAPAVRATLVRIYQDACRTTQSEAETWAHESEHEQGRYFADVFV